MSCPSCGLKSGCGCSAREILEEAFHKDYERDDQSGSENTRALDHIRRKNNSEYYGDY